MNANSLITKGYRKKGDFAVRINKPNFRNGQNERKLTYNKGLQKKRLFSSPKNKPKTNPIKPNFKGKKLLAARSRMFTFARITPSGGWSSYVFLVRTKVRKLWPWAKPLCMFISA